MTLCWLFTFGFETPGQRASNDANGWDDEDSASVIVIGGSESEALEWGRQVAEEFVRRLHGDPEVSWRAGRYADGIEPIPAGPVPAHLSAVPVVACGEYPDWTRLPAPSRG